MSCNSASYLDLKREGCKSSLIVFSGYNTRAVIALCRHLRKRNLSAIIVASGDRDPILVTDYKDWVFLQRDSQKLELKDFRGILHQARAVSGADRLVVVPTTEFLNRFLLTHRSALAADGVEIPLVGDGLYRKVSDKRAFKQICQAYGLEVPHAVSRNRPTFPCVAKKIRYEDGCQAKPYLLWDSERFSRFKESELLDDYFFEEFVTGQSYYLLFYISPSGTVVKYSQKNLVQQADGRSIIAAEPSTVHLSLIAQRYADLFTSIGFHGVVMVELRRDGKHWYMIEANPRFWGPLQLVVDNCPELVDAFLQDAGCRFEATTLESARRKYFWYGGMVSDWTVGRHPAHFDCGEVEMRENLDAWLADDVYMRADTLGLFGFEILKKVALVE